MEVQQTDLISDILDSKGSLILVALFMLLFASESIFALRRRIQSRARRVVINTIVSIPAFISLRLVFIPVVVWIAFKAQTLEFGLFHLLALPTWINFLAAFLLLDYGNYLWHVLLHRLPILWRFHLVHHTDLDLDVLTATRFHFVELFASVIFRGGILFILGVPPQTVLIYEIVFEAATQFHHSNLRLPVKLETMLGKIFVTPRMHGIHHSIIKHETDSNYSVIFSFWDRLHKTLRLSVHQDALIIGVPSYQNADELTGWFLLKLPFTKIRSWTKAFLTRTDGLR
ncbi:MAG TPA: sterol desaturase family protein [Chryseolinea sp.]|nr:sterol desaturase family protein [Chryseolinea sp.]